MQDESRKCNRIEKSEKESCCIDKYEVHHTSLWLFSPARP